MLIENTLFGIKDKEQIAIERFKCFEPAYGYYLAFSGGKDSIVILDLAKRAKVKFDLHHAITTVDAPEVVRFCRENGCEMIPPKKSMATLIREKNLPTRIFRFCCAYLKEQGGKGRTVVTGIRWAESVKRGKRKMVEAGKGKNFVNPIIDWSNEDVWEYIRKYNLKYPSLYDKGWKRIGCIGCPMAGLKRIKEFEQFPNFEKIYKDAARYAYNKNNHKWKKQYKTFEDYWDWWINEPESIDPNQCLLVFED